MVITISPAGHERLATFQAVVQAWNKEQRPDWLMWLIARLARTDPYYARASCSAVSVVIDVLMEPEAGCCYREGDVRPEGLRPTAQQEARARNHAHKLSVCLDQLGQGRSAKRPARARWGLSDGYSSPLTFVILHAENMLACYHKGKPTPRFGAEVGTVAHYLDERAESRRELCQEIRRVVERPTLAEIVAAAR